jgi:creatinine amidohydrolase
MISRLNWSQVEDYLKRDDRCVLPLGCTEQHAGLSLSTDTILAERVSLEAAEPLGIPVFPALAYGLTPSFMAYPGTVTLRLETLVRVVDDILTSLSHHGFRRILIVNGHGGNAPAASLCPEWMARHPDCRVRFVNWWNAPRTWAAVQAVDSQASHASWMENFPWTRLPGVTGSSGRKAMVDPDRLRALPPGEVRKVLGDGCFGGPYQVPDEAMVRIWSVAVAEIREILKGL